MGYFIWTSHLLFIFFLNLKYFYFHGTCANIKTSSFKSLIIFLFIFIIFFFFQFLATKPFYFNNHFILKYLFKNKLSSYILINKCTSSLDCDTLHSYYVYFSDSHVFIDSSNNCKFRWNKLNKLAKYENEFTLVNVTRVRIIFN